MHSIADTCLGVGWRMLYADIVEPPKSISLETSYSSKQGTHNRCHAILQTQLSDMNNVEATAMLGHS